jgi:hypothetical protein
VALLRQVRELLTRLGRPAEVDNYLPALRVEYRRTCSFIKLLDEIG